MRCVLGTLIAVLSALAAPGCGESEKPAPPPPAGPLDYRPCAHTSKVGELRVELAEHYTAASGNIAEAVVPASVRMLVAQEQGCRLLQRRLLHCDPACAAGTTCGEGGACLRYPENLDAGTVLLTGLARPVSMTPRAMGKHYSVTTLPHPGFQPGADILLTAAGSGGLPAFSLRGWGVSPLDVPMAEPVLEEGRPLDLTWTAGPPGPARLVLVLTIDQHGRTPAALECQVPDTGVVTLPASLLTALRAAGASGYPSLVWVRQTVDSVVLPPGCVELVVAARLERTIKLPGHTPCLSDGECPAGKTCNVRTQTCID